MSVTRHAHAQWCTIVKKSHGIVIVLFNELLRCVHLQVMHHEALGSKTKYQAPTIGGQYCVFVCGAPVKARKRNFDSSCFFQLSVIDEDVAILIEIIAH
ncbi:MAG: hypothetical protein COW42_03255 [Deltaproteobacteria bacterium CG17_big_fil_post_rev_8_21_14_2_50_63_7]|nr:MAG: hypothetical protein COW42_03255 [Deltaproteobacteria bacterium CG17_big_fil_post_rev_8_21_14_2_50_63_7]